jgi:predicted peptidase
LDAYVLAPQCPENEYWDSSIVPIDFKNPKKMPLILTELLNRIEYGRLGCLEFSFAHPEMFAALVPIAGFVDRVPMIENCKIYYSH